MSRLLLSWSIKEVQCFIQHVGTQINKHKQNDWEKEKPNKPKVGYQKEKLTNIIGLTKSIKRRKKRKTWENGKPMDLMKFDQSSYYDMQVLIPLIFRGFIN